MRRLRNIFYINAFNENNEIVNYGLEFREFLKCIPVKLNNFLLLEAEYYGKGFSSKSKLYRVDKSDIDEFCAEDIYSYGNFCWVDYNDEDNLEKLEPMEVAELLYLGHMFKPVNSAFFEKIQNRYAYLAHDDGWFCRLYCRNFDDVQDIVSNKIISEVSTSKRRKIYPIPDDLKRQLISLAENGLLIDFSNFMIFDNRTIEIPIYTIGKFLNMDEMYNDLIKHVSNAKYSAKLVQKNKSWKIDYVISK